jgi:hypothetical protein
MEPQEGRLDNHPFAVAARVMAVGAAVTVTFASLGPISVLPKLLYSNNLEHFAAFYVVTLTLYAARYRARLARVVLDSIVFATILEAARLVMPGPRPANFEHWMADLGGILAAAAPVVAAGFRRSFLSSSPSSAAKSPRKA